MLVIRTYLKDTGSKGIGLFAAESIPKGTVWWRDDRRFNLIMPAHYVATLPELAKTFVHTYGSLGDSGDWYVCVDNARFVNHSDSPNTAPAALDDATGTVADWITTRDISAGEEITSDYRQFCATCKDGLCFRNQEYANGSL